MVIEVMITSEIKALDFLTQRFKLSEGDAREVILGIKEIEQNIANEIEDEFLRRKGIFLTKDDKVELVSKIENQKVELIEKIESQKVELIEKIENQKVELIEKIESQRVELIEKIESQRVELIEKIEKTRADVIKWMFIFWVGQLAAMFGLLKIFFS